MNRIVCHATTVVGTSICHCTLDPEHASDHYDGNTGAVWKRNPGKDGTDYFYAEMNRLRAENARLRTSCLIALYLLGVDLIGYPSGSLYSDARRSVRAILDAALHGEDQEAADGKAE